MNAPIAYRQFSSPAVETWDRLPWLRDEMPAMRRPRMLRITVALWTALSFVLLAAASYAAGRLSAYYLPSAGEPVPAQAGRNSDPSAGQRKLIAQELTQGYSAVPRQWVRPNVPY